jgi:hypothetical protein
MPRYKVISNLLEEVVEKDKKYNLNIQIQWDIADRLYKNNIAIEHFIKSYVMYVNHSTIINLFFKSLQKELRNDYLDKGEAHE